MEGSISSRDPPHFNPIVSLVCQSNYPEHYRDKGNGRKNILERLVEVSPGMEIWWDSSPLIYDFLKRLFGRRVFQR